MSQNLKGSTYRSVNFGQKIDRATQLVPQTGTTNIFTVTGRVILTGLVGLVTAAGSATDPLIKLRAVPTVGTAQDLCAVAGTFTSSPAGTVLTLDGNPATALSFGTASGQVLDSRGVLIPAGAIAVVTGASNATLAVQWSVLWVPFDDGSTLVAA